MRLAFLASGFADYSVGLASALQTFCEVGLFADRRALAREGVEPPPGAQAHLFRQDRLVRRWGGLAPTLAALARFRPDAVLAHEHPHPHLTLLLRAAARLAPVGLIVHDPEPHPGRDQVFAARRARETALQRRLAGRLFTHGTAAATRLGESLGRPAVAIPHGPILVPQQVRPAAGAGRVLMFGRMEAYKGLDTLLEAHRRLLENGVAATLELRGDGPELARLEDAFLALGRCEVHRGYASRGELLQALDACDLVVAPYRHASGSGVAAAAMANGRGLVASGVGGLAEVIRPGVNGLTTPPGDAGALACAIERALPQAGAFGQAGLALSDGAFSWRHAATAIHEALESAAGRTRGAA